MATSEVETIADVDMTTESDENDAEGREKIHKRKFIDLNENQFHALPNLVIHFFEINQQQREKLSAYLESKNKNATNFDLTCKKCNLNVRASLPTTSNLHKHLKSCRRTYRDEMVLHQNQSSLTSSSKKLKTSGPPSVSQYFKVAKNKESLVKTKICDYIINKMLPLSHVEDPDFKAMIAGK
jgi:hypothetical protein